MSDGRSGVPSMRRVRNSMYDVVREAFISGLAVVVPLVITIAVFLFLLNTVYGYVSLFSDAIAALPIVSLVPAALGISPQTLLEATVPVAVFGAVLGIGLVVNSSRYGQRAVEYFDYVMAQIPGVGSVYESFRRMSDVMLESDAENFREVKLVEFPHEEAYTLGFVTTETPEVLRTAADHEEMLTLFLPLAPNPVMGGHLVHLPESRVMDAEMTVEDGAIVTSGVAMTSPDDDGLSREALASLTDADLGDETTENGTETNGDASNARHDEHERLDPKHAETPADLARFRDGHNARPRTDDEGEDR
ncbi:DUF502 domain-containing protein [Halobellus inordinatus]|uniref:DUF502 domain-containing protein n=1 Tax=Halobellus inordinatus TaxID=1126236 RepID=UPI0021089E63|nr:DUF502 domain-containing protein [Halobellus inordinatus]